MNAMVIDLFAGAGGASVGLEAALGRPVDVAINHDPVALAVHRDNHPHTRHLEADIWEVRPREVTMGRPVSVAWVSPDCRHFSLAKAGQPRQQNIRSLAWVVKRWCSDVRPDVVFVENVREFQGWGPLDKHGYPIKAKAGTIFRRWCRELRGLGYQLDYRLLDASEFGAPTRRIRLFIVARCDGRPIVWPEPTHGRSDELFGLEPVHTAAECIDWSIPCPSIFGRPKPLEPKTLWRVAEGLRKFVIEEPEPFIVPMNASNPPMSVHAPLGTVTTQHNRFNLVVPTLIQTGYGEREGQAARVPGLDKPLGTIVAGGQKHALVAAFLSKHYGGVVGVPFDGRPLDTITAVDHHALTAATLVKLRGRNHGASLDAPMPTITAKGNHIAEVRAFLISYYGQGVGQAVTEPLRTITTKDRLGLVTVHGWPYVIADIGMRMLQPHELLKAQFGRFALAYSLQRAIGKKQLSKLIKRARAEGRSVIDLILDIPAAKLRPTKAQQVRLIGNSVCPEVAEAVVRANVPARLAAAA